MKLFSFVWFPSSNTVAIKTNTVKKRPSKTCRERERGEGRERGVLSEASTSMEGTLGGMSMNNNLQTAKASPRTSSGHQKAIFVRFTQQGNAVTKTLGFLEEGFLIVSAQFQRTHRWHRPSLLFLSIENNHCFKSGRGTVLGLLLHIK